MSADCPVALLDTNIWLDYYDHDRSGYANAFQLVNELGRGGFTIVYASTSAKDMFYVLGSTLKKKAREQSGQLTQRQAEAAASAAWGCLRNMTAIAVAGTHRRASDLACRAYARSGTTTLRTTSPRRG